jgi:hypothetical protein|tara:strand:- start:8800 stop:9048 length:249 start_codon:yes stop_codon:yes gene_type:complete
MFKITTNVRSFIFLFIFNNKVMAMIMQKHWWLGFLGSIGLYKLPEVLSYFQGTGSALDLLNLCWLLWFLYFLPEENTDKVEK